MEGYSLNKNYKFLKKYHCGRDSNTQQLPGLGITRSIWVSKKARPKQNLQEIKRFSDSYTAPWCCIGDFNAIRSPWEKQGGKSIPEQEFTEFIEFINYCRLIDLGYAGPAYTWSNRRQAQFLIWERQGFCRLLLET